MIMPVPMSMLVMVLVLFVLFVNSVLEASARELPELPKECGGHRIILARWGFHVLR